VIIVDKDQDKDDNVSPCVPWANLNLRSSAFIRGQNRGGTGLRQPRLRLQQSHPLQPHLSPERRMQSKSVPREERVALIHGSPLPSSAQSEETLRVRVRVRVRRKAMRRFASLVLVHADLQWLRSSLQPRQSLPCSGETKRLRTDTLRQAQGTCPAFYSRKNSVPAAALLLAGHVWPASLPTLDPATPRPTKPELLPAPLRVSVPSVMNLAVVLQKVAIDNAVHFQ
jgi:hypothetical protein